jgi:diguanylate cyclase (GGDEF)-like protein
MSAATRFAALVAGIGFALLVWIAVSGRVGNLNASAGQFWILVAFVVLGEMMPIRLPRREEDEEISTGTTFAFALLISAGTAAAVLALALAQLCAYFLRGRSFLRSAFNVGQQTIALAASGFILKSIGGVPHEQPPFFTSSDLPVILLGAAVYFLVYAGLGGVYQALQQGADVKEYLRKFLPFRASITGASLALSPIVVVAADHSLPLIPLLLVPLVALYRGGLQAAINEYQALHDHLTTLPNRFLLNDRVSQAILAAGRDRSLVAVMLMDLDRFKEVNDTLGHHSGDLLLQQVGPRLRSVLRESDTIARLGGDEFAILLPNVVDRASALSVADKLKRALSLPFEVQGLRLNIEASIGIAFFPDHAEDVETLIQRADVAMYVAKRTGGGYAIYASEHDLHSPTRLALVGQMKQALETDEIELYYQPKAELLTGAIVGAEALVRWHHSERGLMSPDEFMPITENTGLIEPFTRYVIEAAVKQAAAWHDAGYELSIAVNVSARSLLDHRLPADLEELLSRYDVNPSMIRLEITESAVMEDPVGALAVLDRLHDAGVALALDDFGTGYSSLSYLKRLPVNEIKIDRSFVMNMHRDEDDAVIVSSTIDLARNLGLAVVAEGVETEEHWARLADLGCDYAQGYYLSPAIAAGEFVQWLRTRERTLQKADQAHTAVDQDSET